MVSFPKISPNLLLGVGGLIAAVFLVNQVRKAGGDIQKALTDIKLPEIKFPDISFPSFPSVFADQPIVTAPLTQPDTGGFNPADAPTLPTEIDLALSRGEALPPVEGFDPNADPTRFLPTGDPFTGREEDRPVETFPEVPDEFQFGGAEFASARNEEEFRRREEEKIISQQPPVIEQPFEVVSTLPTDQTFGSGGFGFVGGSVGENPIDTLSEVLQFFPELSSSQAADFLAETGGKVLPSEIELVDPDIRNVVVAGGDFTEQQRVDTSPQDRLSSLESEASRAAETSCRLFGLNCDLVDSQMA